MYVNKCLCASDQPSFRAAGAVRSPEAAMARGRHVGTSGRPGSWDLKKSLSMKPQPPQLHSRLRAYPLYINAPFLHTLCPRHSCPLARLLCPLPVVVV